MDDEQFVQFLQSVAGEYRRTVQERPFSDRGTVLQSFEHQFRPQYLPLSQLSIQFPGRDAASRVSSRRIARRGLWPVVVGRMWVRPLLSVIFLSAPACLLLELAILLSRIVANPASLRSTYLYRAAELLIRWDEAFGVSLSSNES